MAHTDMPAGSAVLRQAARVLRPAGTISAPTSGSQFRPVLSVRPGRDGGW